ncbi:MAG TPA: hypothetical protein P5532_24540 [Planctomycetota bacterium]|mgnify:CR=1 FL=1|nr:hypothetical protein [Planctomycetota bacterium]
MRYDLGGIGKGREGCLTVNLVEPCDIVHDITDLDGFIPGDGGVEEFRLVHTLEHVHPTKYRQFLLDLRRKLRWGGEVRVVQSDVGAVLRQWLRGELPWRAMRTVLFTPEHVLREEPLRVHYNMWTQEELARDFEACGFRVTAFDAGSWRYDHLDPFFPEETLRCHGTPILNLGVLATKE